ncbi:hypothetical protein WJX74_004506 [Apatococcus lobatus]|uniref:Uncharacterized protein n=1 Tax=Apatococcus lobatus TaxID=904363 RepID=A0AAW1QM03_9CHLO
MSSFLRAATRLSQVLNQHGIHVTRGDHLQLSGLLQAQQEYQQHCHMSQPCSLGSCFPVWMMMAADGRVVNADDDT